MKKNILLIGGSHGIGRELIDLLIDRHNLYVVSREAEDLENLDLKHFKFDVLNDDLNDLELPERLDAFVYFPGSINLKPFKLLKPKDYEDEMQLNFFSLVKSLQAVLPNLKKSEQASLVFYSSIAAQKGMPFHTSVAAAKAAIEGFAKSLAAEYAPSFRVNVIAPSLIDTPLAEKLLSNEKKVETMKERHPLKRVGTAADIAQLTAFLLEDQSSWITGQILGVDGGLSQLNLS
ncbi:SDR family NAD(P)-dependent oxidoreductase [Salegentibacter sp. HM20]